MGFSNVALRGSSYWWRKKMTVAGVQLTLALPMGAMSFKDARVIALRLGSAAEALRMGYGQVSSGVSSDQLKKVFSDAMRWQLRRILSDQVLSSTPAVDHATINSRYAEAWTFLAKHGVDGEWTLDDHESLIDQGWNGGEAKAVADLVFDLKHQTPISRHQTDTYAERFWIAPTTTNLDKTRRVICAARAAACRKATADLSLDEGVTAEWIEDALADDAPFAWEAPLAEAAEQPIACEAKSQVVDPVPGRLKKRLVDAAEECVGAHEKERAWDADTIKQVRTAVRLFDYACGSDVFVEEIEQSHVTAFTNLCRALPNRWGRTTEERAGGFAASLERAKTMTPGQLGLSQVTINKHITWIMAVLDHAAGATKEEGHRPALPITFTVARKGARLTNHHQGIYVYRENRLIHDASWLGMFTKEPHGTLLRVEFSFDHDLDEAFQVDIKKSQILLNPVLYGWLRDQFLTAPRRQADRVYRDGVKKKVKDKADNAHSGSNEVIKDKEKQVGGPTVQIADAGKNQVLLTNSKGQMTINMPVLGADRPGEVAVSASDEVPDGLLYRPVLIEGKRAVQISTRHPYYERVYVPNLAKSTTVTGMDSLLWALAVAELDIASPAVAEDLEEMRFKVSRMLRKLVESLPEAAEGDLD